MSYRLVAPLILVLVLAVGCSAATAQKTALQAQSATLDSIELADAAAKLAAKTFDTNCPRATLFTVDQCRGWRQFSEGREPASAVCQTPTFLNLPDVFNKCGFRTAFPVVIRAYQEGKETLVSVTQAVNLMINGAKNQTALANSVK